MMNQNVLAQPHSLTLVPPGPVTDKTNVEIRLAVRNQTESGQLFKIRFYRDDIDPEHRIGPEISSIISSGGCKLVRAWWETTGFSGHHTIRYEVQSESAGIEEGRWHLEIYPSEKLTVPLLLGGWCDPGALVSGWGYSRARKVVEQDIRDQVDAMQRIGMNTIIISYVEYGMAFYPSDVLSLSYFGMDVVENILSQADENGMHVFLGLGRGEDIYLLWTGLDDQARINAGIELSASVARELWENYHHHPSFYGWYFTHEMDDLARASRYYNPVADSCHAFSPDKPVLVAPAGTPIITRQILENSHVDIFAYQDAVGAGFKNYTYTLDPEIRIADLDSVYQRYSAWHKPTDKHIWSDLEIWRANPITGYSPGIPAPFDQVQRQMQIECNYVEMLTGYEFMSQMEFPESTLKLGGDEAIRLYTEYRNYYEAYWQNAGIEPVSALHQPESFEVLGNYPNPFNSSTTIYVNLQETAGISIKIFNIRGRLVRSLVDYEQFEIGMHHFKWDGCDENNRQLASGIYLLRFEKNNTYRSILKLILSR
ncbi:DUF4434 domain-containing protein [candidate division KSB1 bacterium]|nr:DUF4434 domain-containing protein [candidate division KSB1 bacterium]